MDGGRTSARRPSVGVLCIALAVVGASCGASAPPPGIEPAAPATLPIFDDDRTDLDPGEPPEVLDEALVARVVESAVQIAGDGCVRLQLGSGFVAGEGIVVTNAHVVAGVSDPTVRTPDGPFAAEVIGFDPESDIAILRVDNLELPALAFAEGDIDDEGAILGFGGSSDASDDGFTATIDADMFRINRLITAKGENIYRDVGDTRRAAYLLAADIEPGDSGAALVRTDGAVVGMAFAASRRPNVTYAVRASEISSLLATPELRGDPTRCAEG